MNDTTDTILLVDDNEDDLFCLRRMLKKAGITNPQQVAMHGQQAMDYLAGRGEFADRAKYPLPFLMFLDLKMPYRDGFEVLTWMREQAALEGIAVVVLTGSDELKDHQAAYALGARSYLVKPPGVADLQALMESLQSFRNRPEFRPAAKPA